MIPLGFLYGIATFHGLKKLKKPMKKAAITTTSQLFNALDCSKEAAYNLKEEVEDIIAEAHYENMKRKQSFIEGSWDEDLTDEGWNNEIISNYLEEKEEY